MEAIELIELIACGEDELAPIAVEFEVAVPSPVMA